METPYRAELVKPYWWPLVLVTISAGVVGFLVGLRRAMRSKKHRDRRGEVPAPQEPEVQQREVDLVSTAGPVTTLSADLTAGSETPQGLAPPKQADS
jgi:hypothetical protein